MKKCIVIIELVNEQENTFMPISLVKPAGCWEYLTTRVYRSFFFTIKPAISLEPITCGPSTTVISLERVTIHSSIVESCDSFHPWAVRPVHFQFLIIFLFSLGQ